MAKYEIGQVYDVWWQIVKTERIDTQAPDQYHYRYTLRNIANGQEVTIHDQTMRKIALGKTSVSKSIAKHIQLGISKNEMIKQGRLCIRDKKW